MIELPLNIPDHLRHVLCLGAHCDDIEIGCAGTILALIAGNPDLRVDWVVFSSTPERAQEARASATELLGGVKHSRIIVKDFRNGYFPYVGGAIKDFFEELKTTVSPDLILTHQRGDLHQDHRQIAELTWNTFRDHLILGYEIPKYDGDLGQPNAYVPLNKGKCERKVALVLRHFVSQRDNHWFTAETFRGLMRLRGIECNSPSGYAEAFFAPKVTLGVETLRGAPNG
jgi:LmbE family N-acetylglucosaminyl deacetylase